MNGTTVALFAATLFTAGLVVGQVVLCLRAACLVWQRLPRSLEAWAAETVLVSLRVPVTGALYAAAIMTFLWLRVRMR